MISPFALCGASRDHSGGLQQSPVPSGGLSKEPLHKIPDSPVQPTPLPEGLESPVVAGDAHLCSQSVRVESIS